MILIPMGPVAMATYCLLAFWLVDRFNWCTSHCFPAVGAISLRCNSIFPRLETLLRASNIAKLELYFETARKLRHEPWNNFKRSKSHSYSCETTFYSYTYMKAYRQVKNTENLSSTSQINTITAAPKWRENTENLTSTSLENNITTALTWSQKYGKPDEYKSRKQHHSGAISQ